ncbi:putative MFS family arabinose efflux permease [Lapillicoccus jejuensis]|uniref:Putative MFS family arabinose efflux permease n=1 Tax=Lapillicoccus jejuensis TaxID=402171 RepID=A0A542DXQ9_9MICO|nr:putative MFS family arabinose efflux permease [Lapillicoccus jejuensis]
MSVGASYGNPVGTGPTDLPRCRVVSWRERLRAVRVDTTPLGHRDFRLLFVAGTVFYLGGMVSYVAVPFQVFALTGSNLTVGLLGLVELVPLVFFGLYGGALADHVDRRRLLVATGAAQALLTAGLAWNGFREHPSLPVVFVLAALLAAAGSLQRPSREALMPRTLPHDRIVAGNALTSLGTQIGVLAGPLLGGVLVASVGAGWCFVVDVAGLVVATGLYAAMRPYPHRSETTPPSLAGIGEGISYALRRRDLLGTYLVDIVCMLLAMPVVLFPALAQEVFRQPQLLGLLYSAETVGALVATALSGWTARVSHHGRAIVLAAATYGLFVGLAGLMPSIGLVVVCLACAGAADMVSGVFRGTVWNQSIPESMRGRLAGIEMLSYSVGPLGGQVRAGLTADLWSVRGSIASGGFACVAGVALTAAWLRDFWRYDASTDEHVLAERAVRAAHGEPVTDAPGPA